MDVASDQATCGSGDAADDSELLRAPTRHLDSFAEPSGVESEAKPSPPPARPEPLSGEARVAQLLESEPGLVTRRGQLNAPYRPKGKGNEDPDEEEAVAEDGNQKKPEPKPKSKGKSKSTKPRAKAKAKSKTKASQKAKSKTKASPKPKSEPNKRSTADKTAKTSKTKLEKKDADASENETKKRARKGDAQTWARRYPPSDPHLLHRHNAVKDVYTEKIAHLLKRQSAFQAGCLRGGWRGDLGCELFLGGVCFLITERFVAD